MGEGREAHEGGNISNYDWFVLLYGRNQHNSVKQLSPNFKKIDIGNRLMDMDGEEEEEGGTRGEKSMEADTLLLYVK